MNKLKLLIENFLVYGLGGIISKIVPLLMIPIVTRIMPNTTYFGISDMSNTIISFASAFAIMGMYDAMYRMFFEKEDTNYKKNICSTALWFTIIMSIVVFCVLLLFKNFIAQFFFGSNQYAFLVYITAIATLVGATNSIISAPTRMQNKRKIFLVTNTISPIISYAISIPLLLNGYYVIALPVAAVVSGITLEVSFMVLNRQWFSLKRFDIKLLKQLLTIAVPLMPNFLIYWVFNSSDRLMITNLIGMEYVGIYSVAAKLGNASQLIYTAFAGGWQFFAFSTMKEENQVKSNSFIFECLGVISFAVSTLVCAWSYLIFRILFEESYLPGYISAPYLFLAPLLQMLFQVSSNQFLIIKKTWPNMLILSIGAIVNVVLNLKLIPVLGIEGASLATLIGYVVSNIICILVLMKMKLMEISKRFIVAVVIMIAYFVLWRACFTENTLISTVLAMGTILAFMFLYRKELLSLKRKLSKKTYA